MRTQWHPLGLYAPRMRVRMQTHRIPRNFLVYGKARWGSIEGQETVDREQWIAPGGSPTRKRPRPPAGSNKLAPPAVPQATRAAGTASKKVGMEKPCVSTLQLLLEMDKTLADTAARIEHCRDLIRQSDRLLEQMRASSPETPSDCDLPKP
jgi:hypothetical protein